MKIYVNAATTMEYEYPFSRLALQALAKSSEGVNIYLKFDQSVSVGYVSEAKVIPRLDTNGHWQLSLEAHIFDEFIKLLNGNYIVPGYIFPGYTATSYGLCTQVQDTNLKPMVMVLRNKAL